ncbi:sugar dehydrogenase complex small subunit [Paraburkholderia bannensis]|uniref:sugar dehydrogenase complex small subunit n=1 Tax=Paraburkholderia bannensis TaxID=765414 RepID=UPI002AB7A8FB|nr:sugar dehydrogenase complex small subunit [Paraburkholderia bannensis]
MKTSHEYGPRDRVTAKTPCVLPDGARRAFLSHGGLMLGALAVFPALAVSQAQAGQDSPGAAISQQDFHQLAQFLTGKTLDGALAVRALAALMKVDAQFGAKAASISSYIAKNTLADVDAFSRHAVLPENIKADALAIIASFYLGYAGTAKSGAAHDNTQFVTYTQALMYRLTERYTPIPSYSRWGTGYWTTVPR